MTTQKRPVQQLTAKQLELATELSMEFTRAANKRITKLRREGGITIENLALCTREDMWVILQETIKGHEQALNDLRKNTGITPLHLLAGVGNPEAVYAWVQHREIAEMEGYDPREGIDNTASVHARDVNGHTALDWAACNDDAPTVKALFRGADAVHEHMDYFNRDKHGTTTANRAFDVDGGPATDAIAAIHKRIEFSSHLALKMANPCLGIRDMKGRSRLHFEAAEGNWDACERTLEQGADVNLTDNEGESAAWTAVRAGSAEGLEVFLRRGLNMARDNHAGETLLYTAVETGVKALPILRRLYNQMEANSEGSGCGLINAGNKKHETPLHALVRSSHSLEDSQRIATALVEMGADPTHITKDGAYEENAVEMAMAYNNNAALEAILRAIPDKRIYATVSVLECLEYAIEQDLGGILDRLLPIADIGDVHNCMDDLADGRIEVAADRSKEISSRLEQEEQRRKAPPAAQASAGEEASPGT